MAEPNVKALKAKIAKLESLAKHPNTPPHEAEAAKNRAKALKAKLPPEPVKPKRPVSGQPRGWNGQTGTWTYTTEPREWHEPTPQDRAEAQRRWAEQVRQQRNRDEADGLRYFEQRMKAQADADQRTPQQRNADMQDRIRHKASTPPPKPKPTPEPSCSKPESFFTPGGYPRQRNQYVIPCEKCGRRLAPGEGTFVKVAGGSTLGYCCETKPGPRRKKARFQD